MSDLANYLADRKGDRSIDDIAKKATASGHPISRSVVAKYLRGEHGPRPPEETLAGLAAGFDADPRELRELVGRPAGELGPYVPTKLSASLTQTQRDALDDLIRAFVKGDSDADTATRPAQKTGGPSLSVVTDDEDAGYGGEGWGENPNLAARKEGPRRDK